jgi:hypothetical protein
MQFPTIPSQRVVPLIRRDVTAVAPATGVVAGEQQAVTAAPQAAPAGPPLAALPAEAERRQGSRRDQPDRRRRQVPVLLDTRTGRDRRGQRRRADDPLPGGVDEAV